MNKSILLAVVLLVACSDSKRQQLGEIQRQPENGLIQEKHIGNFNITCTYLPAGWKREKRPDMNRELLFRINVQSPVPALLKEKSGQQIASYGVDTLFQLVSGPDTILPRYAERIANGDLGGAEYMVAFSAATNQQSLQFIFRDWIYSNTRLVFPLQTEKLHQSDSLSVAL